MVCVILLILLIWLVASVTLAAAIGNYVESVKDKVKRRKT